MICRHLFCWLLRLALCSACRLFGVGAGRGMLSAVIFVCCLLGMLHGHIDRMVGRFGALLAFQSIGAVALSLLHGVGCDCICHWCLQLRIPSVKEVILRIAVMPELCRRVICLASRPGHFLGVCVELRVCTLRHCRRNTV